MRRLPAWIVGVGVLAAWAGSPAVSRAEGVWLTLAAGAAGGTTPAAQQEFWFDSPHGPPLVGVNQFNGGSTLQAQSGGGSVFFGGAGTPVLLNLSDGSAYIAGGTPPDSAAYRGPGGTTGTPSSAAPVAGGTLPSSAALLGINLSDPALGPQSLTATVTDPSGNPLGSASVGLSEGDWWVIGLTPGAKSPPDPGPIDPGGGGNTGGGPPIPGPGPAPSPGSGGSIATPEPASVVLLGIGGVALGAYRRAKRWSRWNYR